MAGMVTGWHWLNAPTAWTADADTVTITTDPDTDFWRTTHYGYVHDTGHVLGTAADGAAPATLLRLAYLRPGPVTAGIMAASPTGAGFTTTFTGVDLVILGR